MKIKRIDGNLPDASMPSMKDVAREAGVSTATVSRVLNQPESVAEHTRNTVLEAAQTIGYRVNQAARSLRSKRTGTVLVLVPNLGNPFFSQILAGIESTLADERFSVLVVDTTQRVGGERLFLEYLHRSRADGVVSLDGLLSAELLGNFQHSPNNFPLVFACEWHEGDMAPSVRVNNQLGVMMGVDHLASLGHKNIGYIGGPPGNVLSTAREEGFRLGLAKQNLKVNPEWFFAGDFSIESGIQAAKQWLNLNDKPTGLFCANDESAIGLISGLDQAGVRVPEDVSVVGFDDIEVARHYIPPLTTIHQPRNEIGRKAARVLINQMKKPKDTDSTEFNQEVIDVELVIRESTKSLAE